MPNENLLKEKPELLSSSNDSTANSYTALTQWYNVSNFKPKAAIPVDVTMLDKIKKRCEAIQSTNFPFEEILLGIASLLLGAFFNALFAGVKLEASPLSIFSYIVCPTVAAGCGVAYAMRRAGKTNSAHQMAKEILECIDDIENQCDRPEEVPTNSVQAVNVK